MSERTEAGGLEFAEMKKMDKNALDEFAFGRVLLVPFVDVSRAMHMMIWLVLADMLFLGLLSVCF